MSDMDKFLCGALATLLIFMFGFVWGYDVAKTQYKQLMEEVISENCNMP